MDYRHGFNLPPEILEICRAIEAAGEDSYVVGGAVRDHFLGSHIEDYDLATSATPEKVQGIFERVIPTGIKHGTVTILLGKRQFEITTLRGDGKYSDGRRPDSVKFIKQIEADLARRDFTINAIAWDPLNEVLHDPFNGRQDLEQRVLRAVGDPRERFVEDGLRVLRGARFAATLEFKVESKTFSSMRDTASGLKQISAERKRDELLKLLKSDTPSFGLDVMARAGLFAYISGELADLAADAAQWKIMLARVDGLPATPDLRFAGVWLGLDPGDWFDHMRFDKRTSASVHHLIKSNVRSWDDAMSDVDVRRLMQKVGMSKIDDLFVLRRADIEARGNNPAECSALADLEARVSVQAAASVPLDVKDLAISGKDLIEVVGLEPGPRIGEILEALLSHVLDIPQDNQSETLLGRARRFNFSDV
jgi:tRNA nucleotidyltransferase (CCA-adding enzyme)